LCGFSFHLPEAASWPAAALSLVYLFNSQFMALKRAAFEIVVMKQFDRLFFDFSILAFNEFPPSILCSNFYLVDFYHKFNICGFCGRCQLTQ